MDNPENNKCVQETLFELRTANQTIIKLIEHFEKISAPAITADDEKYFEESLNYLRMRVDMLKNKASYARQDPLYKNISATDKARYFVTNIIDELLSNKERIFGKDKTDFILQNSYAIGSFNGRSGILQQDRIKTPKNFFEHAKLAQQWIFQNPEYSRHLGAIALKCPKESQELITAEYNNISGIWLQKKSHADIVSSQQKLDPIIPPQITTPTQAGTSDAGEKSTTGNLQAPLSQPATDVTKTDSAQKQPTPQQKNPSDGIHNPQQLKNEQETGNPPPPSSTQQPSLTSKLFSWPWIIVIPGVIAGIIAIPVSIYAWKKNKAKNRTERNNQIDEEEIEAA